MRYFLHILLVLFLLPMYKTYAQIDETSPIEKYSFIITSSNQNISPVELNTYKLAVNNFTTLDELRFLDQRRIIQFEKDGISIELLSANELFEKYGKEIPNNTIVPGTTYLPVRFQLIHWENGFMVHPIFDKFNQLTY